MATELKDMTSIMAFSCLFNSLW